MENSKKISEIDEILNISLQKLDAYLNSDFNKIIDNSSTKSHEYKGNFLTHSIVKLPINIASKHILISFYVNTSRTVRKIFAS